MKALVVSADPTLRQTVRLAVEGTLRRIDGRSEFLEALNGEQAVKVARRAAPDLVLADEIASRMGAFAMAKDLRDAEVSFPGVIVILLDRPMDGWLAKWSGADAWFTKPVDPFALASRVEELLREATREVV